MNGSGKVRFLLFGGNPAFEVTKVRSLLWQESVGVESEDRSHEGIFLSFQYPVEIRVSMVNFYAAAVNEQRKYKGLPALTASEFLKLMRENVR